MSNGREFGEQSGWSNKNTGLVTAIIPDGRQPRPCRRAQPCQVDVEQWDANTGKQRDEQRSAQPRVLPRFQSPPVGRYKGNRQSDRMR